MYIVQWKVDLEYLEHISPHGNARWTPYRKDAKLFQSPEKVKEYMLNHEWCFDDQYEVLFGVEFVIQFMHPLNCKKG